MTRNIYVSMVCLCLWTAQAWGQTDCLEQFRSIQEKTRLLRAQAGKKGFEMECRIAVTSIDGKVYRDKMTMGTQGEKYKYTSNKYAFYQDAKNMVVVQHDRRVVLLSQASPKALREAEFADVLKLQDSLLSYMNLVGCEKEFGAVNPGEGYQKLRFVPGERISGAGLKAVTYWVESSTQQIRKVAIEYAPKKGYQIRSYVMIIDRLSASASSAPFSGAALAMVMSDGTLKREYRAYQLIDKRSVR